MRMPVHLCQRVAELYQKPVQDVMIAVNEMEGYIQAKQYIKGNCDFTTSYFYLAVGKVIEQYKQK